MELHHANVLENRLSCVFVFLCFCVFVFCFIFWDGRWVSIVVGTLGVYPWKFPLGK
jgi:hypothetical protein